MNHFTVLISFRLNSLSIFHIHIQNEPHSPVSCSIQEPSSFQRRVGSKSLLSHLHPRHYTRRILLYRNRFETWSGSFSYDLWCKPQEALGKEQTSRSLGWNQDHLHSERSTNLIPVVAVRKAEAKVFPVVNLHFAFFFAFLSFLRHFDLICFGHFGSLER
jgi:hypothetical protein